MDKLNKKSLTKVEAFVRPDHYDFMDTAELTKTNFTGYRTNGLTQYCEIWLKGTLRMSISPQQLKANPAILNQALEDVFCLNKVMPDTPMARMAEALEIAKGEGLILLPDNFKQ